MKIKQSKTVFIIQTTEGVLKIIKCLSTGKSAREFSGLQIEMIPIQIDDQNLRAKIKGMLKKLGYDNNEIIISLPRRQVTCRYLKIPSVKPEEIEKISNLQAGRYLPYPAAELVTGYQIIDTDKEGYSHINLIIVHTDIIGPYIGIFKELRVKKYTIGLNSYGLCNLYSCVKPQESGPVLIIDIDSNQAELAVISKKKLFYSRAFRLSPAQAGWESRFIDEIKKTCNAYSKEVSAESLTKIIIFNTDRDITDLNGIINKQISLPVEVLPYAAEIRFSQKTDRMLNSGSSFAGLIGLGLEDMPQSLNLLPEDIKENLKSNSLKKRRLQIILLMSGIVLISVLNIAKSIDNKAEYLDRIKMELNKVSKDTKPLEEIEKRLKIIHKRPRQGPGSLDILYELHAIMPTQVYLTNFSYEEKKQIILHGQSPERDSVFAFVSALEKSALFKSFEVKVKYATQKKAKSGEAVDFEILCLKK